jgi:hypothetical protein
MPEVKFLIAGAHAVEHAAVPTLAIEVRVNNEDAGRIENILLQAQIQIESPRRPYNAREKSQLTDLFGTPDRWAETLRTMHWTKVSTLVPGFQSQTVADLPIACTFDFNVAATKYFYALEEGEIPLLLLFSGTIFYRDSDGALQVQQIPWSKEAVYRLPVNVWRRMMELYYPNSAWLSLRQDVFDRLYQFKRQSGIATWDQTLERLLTQRSAVASPSQEASP